MTPSNTALCALFASPLFLLACSEAPSEPTWLGDIRPLVQANCVRCHTPPSIGGAPIDFRLDVYDDTLADSGKTIWGARTMARYMAVRAAEEGDMPPDQSLAEVHGDAFANWVKTLGQVPALGSRANNLSPQALLRSALGAVDDEELVVAFDVSDAQGDMVWGELSIGDVVVSRSLHAGRNQVPVAAARLPEGNHAVVAFLSDDENPVRRELGTLAVSHAGGTAPTLSVATQGDQLELRDRLFAEPSVTLVVGIADPDAGDSHEIDVIAFRGSEEVAVASAEPATGNSTDIVWDTASMPEGAGWRLRVTAADSGGASSTIETGRIVISHASTSLGIEDVAPILQRACAACHPRAGLPGLDFFLSFEPDDLHADVEARRGLLYRRVIQEGTMPPQSAPRYAEDYDGDPSYEFLSSAEKATLAEYLLGGSPR